MDTRHTQFGRRVTRAWLAVLAAVLLVAGASWGSLAAGPTGSQAQTVAAQQTAPAARALAGGRESYADIVSLVAPAVVTIRVEGQARVAPTMMPDDDLFRRFFGDQGGQFGFGTPGQGRRPRNYRQQGLGSGVVVTGDGYILTNHHVVDGAQGIRVDFADGRTFDARMIGSDKPSDLAVVKIDATNLQPLALGDSDAVQVGDVVLAIGNPLGVGQTVTMGIISAKGRSTGNGDGGYQDFLQTDAPINQGNSGGALVNLRGELIGINSQILSPSQGNIGIGFSIPSNMARHVADELRTEGRVRRAQLGVTIQPVTSEMAESLKLNDVSGAIISNVAPGSAAERAGIRRGDVIKSFNGQPVRDTNSLRNRVAGTSPGSSASVVIIREGSERTFNVTLDEVQTSRTARNRGGSGPAAADDSALGVSVAPLSASAAEQAGLPKGTTGLMVRDVDPEGRAASAGIQAGDVIAEVNQKPVTTVEDLRAALKASADRPVLLLVSRDGQARFVTVRPS